MPVTVPTESKKYTTVYDNFKGVDFTNDPSNVYRRRSPDGTNMLPDLDGRPYKRTGWKVETTVADFQTAASSSADVAPDRMHHFSLGGHDFLMVFNTLGVFYLMDGDSTPVFIQLASGSANNPTLSSFPPQIGGESIPADANRAFFFEGNGGAGFYVFVANTLFKFYDANNDGNYYFWEVTPHSPIVLIATSPYSCAGTQFESLNMLTDRRTVSYMGDGTQYYTLPSAADGATVKVQKLSGGVWTNVTTGWSYNAGVVTFTSAPASSTVDNVRISYVPSSGQTYSVSTVYSGVKAITNKKTVTQTRTVVKKVITQTDGSKKTTTTNGAWRTSKTAYTYGKATLSTPNNYNKNSAVFQSNHSGSYATVSTGLVKSWNSYGSAVDMQVKLTSIADGGTSSTTTGGLVLKSTVIEWRESSWSFLPITTYTYTQTRTITYTKKFSVRVQYPKYTINNNYVPDTASRDAFAQCRKVLTFGNNLSNQIFLTACTAKAYSNRVWYSAMNDPTYFPDTNYVEVGADDKPIYGLLKVSQYLGIVKKGSGTEASIYLAYATSFDEETTYAVKQSVSGIGAISTGAFNILNEEPLFLSDRGVAGINLSEADENKIARVRSWFVNKRLLDEPELENAVSYVFQGMYYLAVNGHCYVLDGSQKNSWANEKTNLQYECYYLTNIPAICFGEMKDTLYFIDPDGNLCRFKNPKDVDPYKDDYSAEGEDALSSSAPVDDQIPLSDLTFYGTEEYYLIDNEEDVLMETEDGDDYDYLTVMSGIPVVGSVIKYNDDYYTITELDDTYATVVSGVPIKARWSTLSDDDGMVHFFKNLQKKGCVVSLLPGGDSGVKVYLKADEKDEVYIGETDIFGNLLPYESYVKKKIKKYKRLQIICANDNIGQGFGLDQIIKTYTVGNYSKNRG